MLLTLENAAVGLKVKCLYNTYDLLGKTGTISNIYTRGSNRTRGSSRKCFDIIWDGFTIYTTGWRLPNNHFEVIGTKTYRKPKKVIPDIPLDTTLHILEAGHLQDRMRKRF